MTTSEEYLTIKEAAFEIGMSQSTIRRLIAQGELAVAYLGASGNGGARMLKSSLEAYKERKRREALLRCRFGIVSH